MTDFQFKLYYFLSKKQKKNKKLEKFNIILDYPNYPRLP